MSILRTDKIAEPENKVEWFLDTLGQLGQFPCWTVWVLPYMRTYPLACRELGLVLGYYYPNLRWMLHILYSCTGKFARYSARTGNRTHIALPVLQVSIRRGVLWATVMHMNSGNMRTYPVARTVGM